MDSDRDGLVELRRYLHSHPELRLEEVQTGARIEQELRTLGLDVRPVAGSGRIATMGFGAGGPHVLVRADMDAYPVNDAKGVEYASTNAGTAHACGHDVHMSVAIGVARRLSDDPPDGGAVTFVFQPAEEIPYGEVSGARLVLDEGVLAPSYSAVLGLHCWPILPVGTVGVEPVIAMAAKDAFRLTVVGESAHAATPSQGRDAILGIASIITGLHAAIAREQDSSDLVVFNIGTVEGGRSQSSLARVASATGTIRTHDQAIRDRIKAAVERYVESLGHALGMQATVEWANEMPPVMNSGRLVALAQRELPGHGAIRAVEILSTPAMTSDDFALYGALGPLTYLKLGVAGPRRGGAPLHAADFDVDEDCIAVGVDAIDAMTRAVLAGALE